MKGMLYSLTHTAAQGNVLEVFALKTNFKVHAETILLILFSSRASVVFFEQNKDGRHVRYLYM